MNLFKTTSINVLVKFISLGVIFYFQASLSKILTPIEYADYSKFITYGSYISLALSMGFSSSILFYSKGSRDFKSYYVKIILFYVFEFLAISIVIFTLWYFLRFHIIENVIYLYTIIFALLLNAYNISMVFFQIKLQLTRFALVNASLSFYLLASLGLMYLIDETTVTYVVFAYITYYFIANLIMAYLVLKDSDGIRSGPTTLKVGLVEHVSYGVKVVPLLILAQFIYLADYVMIDVLLTDIDLSVYFVAMMISKLCFVIADTAGTVIFPIYLNSKHKGADLLGISEQIMKISRLIFVLVIIILFSYYLFGENFIRLFYADLYISAYEPTLILIGATQGMVIYKIVSKKLAADNRWIEMYAIVLISAFVNIVLNYIFIPIYGITGAAFCSFISYWLCGLLLVKFTGGRILSYLVTGASRCT